MSSTGRRGGSCSAAARGLGWWGWQRGQRGWQRGQPEGLRWGSCAGTELWGCSWFGCFGPRARAGLGRVQGQEAAGEAKQSTQASASCSAPLRTAAARGWMGELCRLRRTSTDLGTGQPPPRLCLNRCCGEPETHTATDRGSPSPAWVPFFRSSTPPGRAYRIRGKGALPDEELHHRLPAGLLQVAVVSHGADHLHHSPLHLRGQSSGTSVGAGWRGEAASRGVSACCRVLLTTALRRLLLGTLLWVLRSPTQVGLGSASSSRAPHRTAGSAAHCLRLWGCPEGTGQEPTATPPTAHG